MTKKERLRVKLTIWLSTTKSWESTRPRCVQVECDTPLESSWQGLQLCFKPHCDQTSTEEVMCPQSCRSPNYWNFDTPIWESRNKKSFGCGPLGELQTILYGGRWWFPLSPGCGESYEFEVTRGSSWHQGCSKKWTNQLVIGWRFEWVIEKLVTLPNPIPALQHAPSTPFSVESWERASSFKQFRCSTHLDSSWV
jgi:hypothetical protein